MRKKAGLDAEETTALIVRLERRELQEADYPLLVDTLKNGVTSLEMLRRKKPGKDDETTDKQDDPDNPDNPDDPDDPDDPDETGDKADEEPKDKTKRKGHGHLGSADYTGARNEPVFHEHLKIGDICPCCGRGSLHGIKVKELINLIATAPVEAIRYLLEHLRCSACLKTFTAAPPENVRPGKCQPSANAAVVVMKYGLGVPFKRLETWQTYFGVPLPDASQFDMSEEVADCLHPVFKHLEKLAADSELLHVDDTSMPIVSLIQENKSLQKGDRYGMNATGILAYFQEHPIYLYYIGRDHAGENIDHLLKKRTKGLPTPLQMGDASSRNTKHGHETIAAFCNSHGVRKFKDTQEAFNWESNTILSLLGAVFKNDAETKKLSKDARLSFHQQHSAPLMDQLYIFMTLLMKKKIVEPASTLGKAITYMLKRWSGFTHFLYIPGAPLDNNIIERALKLMIRLRKNAFFFKNTSGAWIGSLLISMLATTTAAKANPMTYLQEVQIHRKDVAENPGLWLPWNYCDRMSHLSAT